MKKRSILIGAVSLVALAATHWLAYNCGVQSAFEDYDSVREDATSRDPYDMLLSELEVLRAAVKCPEDFSKEDIRKWRDETEATISVVETMTLDYCKKKGDERQEKQIRARIHEARDLLSKLPK